MKHINHIVFLALLLLASAVFARDFDPAAFIIAHNNWRAEVGVNEKLSYSAELAASSQPRSRRRRQRC
jgi:hypothetical protein